MNKEKRVLIITDELDSTKGMAKDIASALRGHKITLQEASAFNGTDLLAAGAVFIGCGEPDPPSFFDLSTMLEHINLAGRPCGLFSPAGAAVIEFLSTMIKDSELVNITLQGSEPLGTSTKEQITSWARTLIEYER